MADWNKPALNNLYVDFLTYMKALTADLAKGCDPAKTTITNPFADMTRFNSATGRWEIYNGTTWGALANSYDINVTTLGGKAANLYALLASPNFSGTPQCPTADVAANNQLLANTAFVQLIKTSMIDGAPANLNTLNKLAASLGNDPAFATTYNTAWSTHLNAADPHNQYAFDSDLTTHAGVAASTTVVGHTRLATNTETTTGTATNIATHPAGVAAAIAEAMGSVSGGGGIQVFTTNGTFTVPNGVTTIYVTAVAGGGGGSVGTTSIGPGGGGGGGCIKYPLTVTPGQQLSISVGQGGSPNNSGGSTTIGALLTLSGGGGATTTTPGIGGTPGGGTGSPPNYGYTGAGGGSGGGAGGGAANCPAGAGTGVAGGGGFCVTTTINGTDGKLYGGGGSGAYSGKIPGSGAKGIAIIEW